MSVWYFVASLVALVAFGVFAICRSSAQREAAQTGAPMPLPTARQLRQWRRERAELNAAWRRR